MNDAPGSSSAPPIGRVFARTSETTLVVAAFLVIALFVGAYYIGIKGERRSAFNRWRPILRALADGEDIYLRYAFPTPPIMALVLYPFALLPGKWGMTAWYLCKVGLTALALRWAVDMTRPAGRCRPRWLVLAALALAIRPIAGDLLHGNVNLWVLFWIVWSLRLFRQQRDWLSGLALALAAASKLTPVLLVGYFAWKRCWKVVGAAAVGLVVWLVLVPGCLLGPVRNLVLLEHWARMIVYPYLVEGRVETAPINQSLPGLVYRLTTASPAIEAENGRPAVFVNFADLERSQARGLVTMLTMACLALLFYFCREPAADRGHPRLLNECCLVLLAMLLLSERSWKHHYVTLLPVYFALTTSAWLERATGPRRAALLWTLLLVSAAALSATSKDVVDVCFGAGASDLAEAYGAYVWAAAALAVGCLLRWEQPPAAGPAAAAPPAPPAPPAAVAGGKPLVSQTKSDERSRQGP